MMSRAERVTDKGLDLPPELESARAKLVYLYLDVNGQARIDEMTEDLGLPMMTVCSLLETLEDKGLIDRDGDLCCNGR